MRVYLKSTALPLIMMAMAGTAHAQTAEPAAQEHEMAGNEIVVTAQHREELLQEVPIAITAFDADTLQNMRVTNALDLNNVAPGLRISSGDAAANPKIFIRGVGLSDFNPSSSGAVSIYVDGVLYGSPLSQLSGFFDVGRVEVLRGPQGTLYGRNTTGGAINVITNRPTQEWEASASIDYGSYDTLRLNAAVGGPIIQDVLAFRVAGQRVRDDGYTENRVTGNSLNNSDRWALRGQLLFTPSSNVEVLAQASFFRTRGGARAAKSRPLFPGVPEAAGADGLCAPAYYYSGMCTDALGYAESTSDPDSVASNLEGEDRVDVFTGSVEATFKLGGVDLISITAYQDNWRDDIENTDGSPLQMIEARYHATQRQFSQEIRLQSSGDSALRWSIGGFYLHDELHDDSSYDVLRDLRPLFVSPSNPLGISPNDSVALFGWPYTQTTDSYAIFGQVDYELTDRLTVTGGLRWSSDTKSFDYVSQIEDGLIVILTANEEKTFSDWSGRLALNYELAQGTNVYASYNRGYKSGGFFGGQATNLDQLEPYDNETLNAYEIGIKTNALGYGTQLNLAAFYYDYQNQQVFAQAVRNGLTVQVLDNAATSRIWGIEGEFSARVAEGLNVNLTAAYLNTRILDYVSEGEDYSGNKLQHSPELSLTAAVNYTYPLANGSALFTNIDANYRSRVYFDNTERTRLSDGPVTLVNGQIGWRSPDEKFEIGAFVQNLFNKDYLLGISNIDSLGVDLMSWAPPRVIGGFLRFSY